MTKTKPSVKLSAAMSEVVFNLGHGWELGKTSGLTPHTWMQHGGVGKGGESKKVKIDTLIGLYRRGIIKQSGKTKSNSEIYTLTELGKSIEL